MVIKSGIIEFEWDEANLDKSYQKHGITLKETEEVFLDEKSFVVPDVRHSQTESRYIILGRTFEKKSLFVVFTIRKEKIRIISSRKIHKKELNKYEKAQKDSQV